MEMDYKLTRTKRRSCARLEFRSIRLAYRSYSLTARWKRGIIPHCMNDPQPEGHMASHIGRRKFLATLGGAAMAWPLAARAQQPSKVWRIGVLETISSAQNAPQLDAFRQRLQQLGYVEGINFVIEYRSAEGRGDRFPSLVAELSEPNGDLLVVR